MFEGLLDFSSMRMGCFGNTKRKPYMHSILAMVCLCKVLYLFLSSMLPDIPLDYDIIFIAKDNDNVAQKIRVYEIERKSFSIPFS